MDSQVNIVLMGLQSEGKTQLLNSLESALMDDLLLRHKTGQAERPITNVVSSTSSLDNEESFISNFVL